MVVFMFFLFFYSLNLFGLYLLLLLPFQGVSFSQKKKYCEKTPKNQSLVLAYCCHLKIFLFCLS